MISVMSVLLTVSATLISSVHSYFENCNTGIERLKQGPINFDYYINGSLWYTDNSFYRENSLFWNFYTPTKEMQGYLDDLKSGKINFYRLTDLYPKGRLWDGEPKWDDVLQGRHGSSYMASALATISNHPDVVKDMFCNREKEVNKVGVYCIRLYIRGKPWMLTIDDEFAWDNSTGSLYFSNERDNILWPALLEKAYAKMKGTYSFLDNQHAATGLRAVSGAPVITDAFAGTRLSSQEVWRVIDEANSKKWLSNFVTYPGDSGELNGCGLPFGQSFQIISSFKLNDNLMTMMRYPKGTDISSYNRRWNHRDTKNWIQTYIDQVPFGYNPLAAWKQGYLFIDHRDIFTCFKEVSIAHRRTDEGYTNNWYDVNDDLGGLSEFTVTMPDRGGDLYFGVESYYSSMFPLSCTDNQLPEVAFTLLKNGEVLKQLKYTETKHRPVVVREDSYSAGDVFLLQVQYDWHWSTARDYTVTVYSRQALEVRDWRNETYEWYFDGDTPNGFTSSGYRQAYPDRIKPEAFGPKSLGDTFRGAHDFWNWNLLYWTHPWLIFWWFTW